jgi:uncharacterized membrane protein YfcA
MTDWWWAYLALGAFVGFFSGLLGIGGGSTSVPVLAFVFAAKGFSPSHVVHLALGTGIASILFTSASSVRSHHLRKAVNWGIVRTMVPGVLIGTFGGALLAGSLDVRLLSIAFTVLIFYFGSHMLMTNTPHPSGALPPATAMSAFGAFIGFIASLSATAGASVVVPFLVKRNVAIHEAIGTAAAIGWPIAAAGTAGYVLAGLKTPNLPEHSMGYVYWPALFGVVFASVLMAPIGASVAHRLPGGILKNVFAIVLLTLATSMLLKFV